MMSMTLEKGTVELAGVFVIARFVPRVCFDQMPRIFVHMGFHHVFLVDGLRVYLWCAM